MICSLMLTPFLVELPVLDNEMYHAVKPGLSAYKDNPEEVCVPVFFADFHLVLLIIRYIHCLQTTKPLGFSLGWVRVM